MLGKLAVEHSEIWLFLGKGSGCERCHPVPIFIHLLFLHSSVLVALTTTATLAFIQRIYILVPKSSKTNTGFYFYFLLASDFHLLLASSQRQIAKGGGGGKGRSILRLLIVLVLHSTCIVSGTTI
jgi:hypothetical protein